VPLTKAVRLPVSALVLTLALTAATISALSRRWLSTDVARLPVLR
jgi:hypothetical protein